MEGKRKEGALGATDGGDPAAGAKIRVSTRGPGSLLPHYAVLDKIWFAVRILCGESPWIRPV
jgi:hypothetical protein